MDIPASLHPPLWPASQQPAAFLALLSADAIAQSPISVGAEVHRGGRNPLPRDALGFECLGTWGDPPVYAIVARDEHRIHFRVADPPTPHPDKYADELLDAYLFVENADALHAEYAARGVEFTRALGDTPWRSREFVVKDGDGRLLAFGAASD